MYEWARGTDHTIYLVDQLNLAFLEKFTVTHTAMKFSARIQYNAQNNPQVGPNPCQLNPIHILHPTHLKYILTLLSQQ